MMLCIVPSCKEVLGDRSGLRGLPSIPRRVLAQSRRTPPPSHRASKSPQSTKLIRFAAQGVVCEELESAHPSCLAQVQWQDLQSQQTCDWGSSCDGQTPSTISPIPQHCMMESRLETVAQLMELPR